MENPVQLPIFSVEPRKELVIAGHYAPNADVTLYHGDRLALLEQIQRAGAQASLIITSPPYNIGKEYEQSISLEDYIEHQRQTIAASVAILADSGSICWQVGNFIDGSSKVKEVFPLDLVLYPIFKSFGLTLKNRIVWTFGHGLHEQFRFSGRHETILWFVKSEQYTFNLDPIRVPQKYPGKRAFRGPKKGLLSGNPDGKNPSDVWDIPNVKSNHVEKTDHPCQFPIGLVERLILSLTNEGDLVVDPYMGAGSTAAAAVMRQRRVAGSETEQRYIEISLRRVRQAFDGTLPYRDMNKPVYEPDERNSVAKMPDEWLNGTHD